MKKNRHIVIVCIIGWIVLLVSPGTVMPIGLLTYGGFAASIAWSAFRHRSTGWGCGLILAILLISLPFWVPGAYHLFEWMTNNSIDDIPTFWPI
ncbi:MAG: hypothetical protein ACI9G1_002723 [Pirellulaceae bacterium]|jgi:hypothetical protein